MRKISIFLTVLLSLCVFELSAKQIKLLAIGNSFSYDAVEANLFELAKANGDTIVIGNMVIGGASLSLHYANAINNSPSYSYRKIVDGVKKTVSNVTISDALKDEVWDYISLQQVSQNSGLYDTFFPYLTNLISYIKDRVINPDIEFVLHSTWAYAQNATHSGFASYDWDQMTMYYAILDASYRASQTAGIKIVIPSGTAIQNARTSKLGDTFCRDGYHLESSYGRYTAACTWYEKLFGKIVIGNKYAPDALTPYQIQVAQHAAHYAVENPTQITSLDELVDDMSKVPFTTRINLSFGNIVPKGFWNLLSSYTSNAVISNLRDINGDLTDISVSIIDRFTGINSSGPTSTTTQMDLPTDVTEQSFYGNTSFFNGVVTPYATIKLSSLNVEKKYDFSIFASRMNSLDNRETYYKFSGQAAVDTILYLNASNNSSETVRALNVAPDGDGVITIEIGAGPNNNNKYGFYYITALSFTPNLKSDIHESECLSFGLYPNPSDKILNIQTNEKLDAVKIMNIKGEILLDIFQKVPNQINIEKLKPGLYIMSVNKNNVIKNYKFIKK